MIGSLRFVLFWIHRVVSGPALSHFVYCLRDPVSLVFMRRDSIHSPTFFPRSGSNRHSSRRARGSHSRPSNKPRPRTASRRHRVERARGKSRSQYRRMFRHLRRHQRPHLHSRNHRSHRWSIRMTMGLTNSSKGTESFSVPKTVPSAIWCRFSWGFACSKWACGNAKQFYG